MRTLSLIVPFYNEQSIVQTFFKRLTDVVEKLDGIAVEYVCVDDGSQELQRND